MWASFTSPGDENLMPTKGLGPLSNEFYDTAPLSSSHSATSKPCRRPVKPTHLFSNNTTDNLGIDMKDEVAPRRSPLKSLYEIKSFDTGTDSEAQLLLRSPVKTISLSKNPISPSGKSIRRISTMLVQRQKSDLADINNSIDNEQSISSPKSKVLKGMESKAVRIRLDGSKSGSKESSPSVIRRVKNSDENSRKSPLSKDITGSRRQSLLSKPKATSNFKANRNKNKEISFSSYDSPGKLSPKSHNVGGSCTAISTNISGKVAFNDKLGLVLFSPTDTTYRLVPNQTSVDSRYGSDVGEDSVGAIAPISSSTPGPTVPIENYFTPYSSGGGVSLSRPSMQRSHAKPTLSSAGREKRIIRDTPEKRKVEVPAKRSPVKSFKREAPRKMQEMGRNASNHSAVKVAEKNTLTSSSSYNVNSHFDISTEITFIPEVAVKSAVPAVLCLSPQKARVSLTNINDPPSVNWRDAREPFQVDEVERLYKSDGRDVAVDTLAASLQPIVIEDEKDRVESEASGALGDRYYECDLSSDTLSPHSGMEHVSRIQMRSQNPSLRGSPFSFPRTMGILSRPAPTPRSTAGDSAADLKLLTDAADNIASSINGITKSFGGSSASWRDSVAVRASMVTQTGVEGERQQLVVRDSGSGLCTGSYTDDSEDNLSLCFSADSGVELKELIKLPEDSFSYSQYNELIRAAREENKRSQIPNPPHTAPPVIEILTPSPCPGSAHRHTGGATSWLSLQSPIDKMHRGVPKSAYKDSVSPPIDLLYTPEPSQPYKRRSGSRETVGRSKAFKTNGEELEDGEIDEGVGSAQPNTGRSIDAPVQCLGLDELLWGSNANSPCEAPIIPNTLTFSTANTPLVHKGPASYRGAGRVLQSPFTLPLSLTQTESSPRTPRLDSAGRRAQTWSAPLSLLGSAVRISPKAAQLTEDIAAADALLRMMRAQSTAFTPPHTHEQDASVEDDVDTDEDQDQSSVFALDFPRGEGEGGEEEEGACDSESERSQNLEISAVLKNLRQTVPRQGDISGLHSGEEETELEAADNEGEECIQERDFAFDIGGSIDENDVVFSECKVEEVEHRNNVNTEAASSSCGALVLRDDKADISAASCEELDTSDLYTTATTISIDIPRSRPDASCISNSLNGSRGKGGRLGGPQSGPLPSLMVTRKKRRKDASIEMKEIVIKAPPGGATTVALTFGNNRPQTTTLRPKAILVRYEPSVSAHTLSLDHLGDKDRAPIAGAAQDAAEEREAHRRLVFSATPECLPLLPGAENVMYVTFSPAAGSSGVYSGALKMRAGNKSFVMLLRGEVQVPSLQVPLIPSSPEVSTQKAITHTDNFFPLTPKIESVRSPEGRESHVGSSSETLRGGLGGLHCLSSTVQHSTSEAKTTSSPGYCYSTYEDVKQSTYDQSNISGQDLITSIETQQDKVRHWLEMEKDRLLGPTHSGSKVGSPRVVSEEAGKETWNLNPKQFQSAMNIRTLDSPSRDGLYVEGVSSNTRGSSPLPGGSLASTRPHAVSPGPAERSVGRRGAWMDDRSGLSDRAVMNALDQAQGDLERSRRAAAADPAQWEREREKSSFNLKPYNSYQQQHENSIMSTYPISEAGVGAGVGTYAQSSRAERPLDKRRPQPSLYFRSQVANFGMTAIGTNSRQRLELCNSSTEEVTVFIGDCELPFVVLHNEVKLRPRSFVKVAVRFVPVSGPKEFRSQLVAQTVDGRHHTEVSLYGSSYWA